MPRTRRPTRVRLPHGLHVEAFNAVEAHIVYRQVETYYRHGIALEEGAVVVDAGANIGIFALDAARRCAGRISLYAFEPIPATYRLLRANLDSCPTNGMKTFGTVQA